jgi:hypothetical protein
MNYTNPFRTGHTYEMVLGNILMSVVYLQQRKEGHLFALLDLTAQDLDEPIPCVNLASDRFISDGVRISPLEREAYSSIEHKLGGTLRKQYNRAKLKEVEKAIVNLSRKRSKKG